MLSGIRMRGYFSSQIGEYTAKNAPKFSKLTHPRVNTVFSYANTTMSPQQSVRLLAIRAICLIVLNPLAKLVKISKAASISQIQHSLN